MPFFSYKVGHGLALAGALAALVGASAVIHPAYAGDDGQAPIWNGIGGLVGLSNDEKQPKIDYGERPRLVLPPKMVLPPPGAAAAQRTAAWPVDPDIERLRKAKELEIQTLLSQSEGQEWKSDHRVSQDTLRADHTGPGTPTRSTHCAGNSQARECHWVRFELLQDIGLQKKEELVAGQEPDRDWLTDPPKGYRVPTKTVAATFEAKKQVNEADPREIYREHDTEQ